MALQPARSQGRVVRRVAYSVLAVLMLCAFALVLRSGLFSTPKRSAVLSPVWHGTGLLHSAGAATYPLFLKIRFERKHEGNGLTASKTNLIGTATICSAGQPVDLELSGTLDAWFAQNGKDVIIYLRTEKSADPKRFFLLYGSWQGADMVLEDRGTIMYFLHPEETEREVSSRSPHQRENSEVVLHYGEKPEFDRLCPQRAGNLAVDRR